MPQPSLIVTGPSANIFLKAPPSILVSSPGPKHKRLTCAHTCTDTVDHHAQLQRGGSPCNYSLANPVRTYNTLSTTFYNS